MSKRIKLLVLGIVTCMMFTACGNNTNNQAGGNNNNSKSNVESSNGANEENDKKEEVKSNNPAKNRAGAEDTLIVSEGPWVGEFLPLFQDSASDGTPGMLMFNTLGYVDSKGVVQPELAEKWDISEDGLTYTVKIRDDAYYWDGTPVTAADVEFTYLALSDPNYDGWHDSLVRNLKGYEEYSEDTAMTLTSMEGIKVIDEKNIELTFKEPSRLNVEILNTGILPKHVYDTGKGNIAEMRQFMADEVYMGSGPYKFVKHEKQQFIEFIRNEDYFLGTPKIENLILKHVPGTSLASELTIGDIDASPGYPAVAEDLAMVEHEYLERQSYDASGFSFIGLNLSSPKLADEEVRQALAYAFDAPGFNKLHFGEFGVPLTQPIVPDSFAYSEEFESKVNPYSYNPEKANQILDEAGWVIGSDGVREKDGVRLELRNLAYTPSKYVGNLVPLLQQQWEAIGVKLTTELYDWGVFVDMTKPGSGEEFDTYMSGWNYGKDPNWFKPLYVSDSTSNSSRYSNERVDELFELAALETDMEKVAEYYQEMALILNEELPCIYTGDAEGIGITNERISNWSVDKAGWVQTIHLTELEP